MSLGKPVIKFTVMQDEMRDFAISEAQKALETSNSEKLVASYMKSTFEKKYKTVWHCIVGKTNQLRKLDIGRNFGAYVTHETGRYIYFYIGLIKFYNQSQKGFLIWQTKLEYLQRDNSDVDLEHLLENGQWKYVFEQSCLGNSSKHLHLRFPRAKDLVADEKRAKQVGAEDNILASKVQTASNRSIDSGKSHGSKRTGQQQMPEPIYSNF